jgi:BirA family biotin operon repressor/biotin-[acetyl-CoA-carboxylase] ligase
VQPSRSPLDPHRVRRLLADGGWSSAQPRLLASVGSTNAEVAALADEPEGTCVVGEEQTAGRGRHDRSWHSPVHAGLWMSVLIRPGDVDVARWGWLPLIAGLAARDAVRAAQAIPLDLKWPNDLVVAHAACGGARGTAKAGGILAEVIGPDAVVIGIGINVSLTTEELPTDAATSLLLEGGSTDREALLTGILLGLRDRLAQWRADDPVLPRDYRAACVTIGRLVDVVLPGDERLHGVVTGIDDAGHLLVDTGGNVRTVTAGDVIHATI